MTLRQPQYNNVFKLTNNNWKINVLSHNTRELDGFTLHRSYAVQALRCTGEARWQSGSGVGARVSGSRVRFPAPATLTCYRPLSKAVKCKSNVSC